MPPNRKSELSARDIPTFNVDQLIIKQHHVVATATSSSVNSNNNSDDYWSWPADAGVQALQQADKIADLFSAAHIEQNLVHAAALQQQQQQACKQETVYNNNTKNDEYWNEPARQPKESEVPAALYRHLKNQQAAKSTTTEPRSYWDWPASDTTQEAGLQRVLEGQRARHLTSAATYEAQLQQQQAQSQAAKLVAAHDAYWVF